MEFQEIMHSLYSPNPMLMFYLPLNTDPNTIYACVACHGFLERSMIMMSPQMLVCNVCYDVFIAKRQTQPYEEYNTTVPGFYFSENGNIISSEEFMRAA